jgi:hypothetical protein
MSKSVLNGCVKTAELATPLEHAKVEIYDEADRLVEQSITNLNGEWSISALCEGQYLRFTADGYVSKVYNKDPGSLVRMLKNEIIGYQDKLWFNPGEIVDVYIHSPYKYRATLFRHGLQKEEILKFENLPEQTQQVPDSYFVDYGLNWNKSFDYTLPVNIQSGLYSLFLEIDERRRFAIPMVISSKNTEDKAKLLVLVSTNTWQSYNIWGGRSRYRNFEPAQSEHNAGSPVPFRKKITKTVKNFLPNTVVNFINKKWSKPNIKGKTWKHMRLSIRRPFTNCALDADTWEGAFTNHLARGEWCILAWLEKEKIAYDVVAGADLHFNPGLLENYKAIVLSTHCEYWSCEMYRELKHYHENHGLWILNLSGNSIYRQIEFYEDGSTRCNSLHFSESCADETQLLGVRFTTQDYGTCAPYEVEEPNHWVFDNTKVSSKKEIFGKVSMNQYTKIEASAVDTGRPHQGEHLYGNGASGWETDKLSKTAPKGFRIVAKGMNSDGGADMVVREPGSKRGGVFSSSSIVFGGSLSVDTVCSSIVKNVLDRALGEDI